MVDDNASEAEEPSGHQQAAGRDHRDAVANGDTTTSSAGKGHDGCEHKATGDHDIGQASASDGAPAATSGQTCAANAEAPSGAPAGEPAAVPHAGEGKAAADAKPAADSADEDGRNAGRQGPAGNQQAPAAGAASSADEAGSGAGNQEAGGGNLAPSAGTAEAAGSADEDISNAGQQGSAEVKQAPAAGVGDPADSADKGSSAATQGDVCGRHTALDGGMAETATEGTCKPSSVAGDAAKSAAQEEGAPAAGGRGFNADAEPGPLTVEAQADIAEAQSPTSVLKGSACAKTGTLAGTAQQAGAEAQSPTTLPEGAEPDTPAAVEGAVQQGAPLEAQGELTSGGARLIAGLSCLWP